jgi:Tol biopolymer transport system component/DNA-binding winged helix-turn-helix (wHTH) protein
MNSLCRRAENGDRLAVTSRCDMPEEKEALGLVRFGRFDFSVDTGELRKDGIRLKLSGQAIQVLTMLVASPGKLITREELQQKLWPGASYGDPEHGLNAAVNKLREVLGDSATTPNYVETLPGRGYRFIANVEPSPSANSNGATYLHIVKSPEPQPAPAPEEKKQAISGDGAEPVRLRTGLPVWARLGIVAGLLCAVSAISYFAWKSLSEEKQELRAVPLNALPGNAYPGSFSPDGQQIAFAWDQNRPSRDPEAPQAFIQIIGTSQPMQLMHVSGGLWPFPAWSPDGKQMAFRKYFKNEVEIVTMPALGGPEVVLGKTCCGSQPGEAFSWSPDGKDLAFKDFAPGTEELAIFLLHLEDLKRTQVTAPPHDMQGDDQPRFSPDGKQIAFVRTLSGGVSQLAIVTVATREVRPLLTEFSTISGIAWDEAGRDLIYASNKSGIGRLWRVAASGGTSRLINVGEDAVAPIISARAHRLAYTCARHDTNIWVIRLSKQDGGEVTRAPLISSTRLDHQPQFSPDNSKIAFISDRSGAPEVWVANKDGNNAVQLTQMANNATGTPMWSPDGKHIAFDSRLRGHGDVYVVALDGSKPRRLTDDGMDDMIPTWSADGKWIYYSVSKGSNNRQIWKIPWEGGQAVQVTRAGAGGIFGFEGPENTLFYLNEKEDFHLWQKRLPDGEERPFTEIPEVMDWNSWQVTAKGIYFILPIEAPANTESSSPLDPPYELRYFDFATKKITKIINLPRPQVFSGGSAGGISISADGKTILYTQTDSMQAEIMMVDNFH